jgi:hypothetical protein
MNPGDTTLHVQLEERLPFEALIAVLSSKFVNLPPGEVDREIEDGQAVSASRRNSHARGVCSPSISGRRFGIDLQELTEVEKDEKDGMSSFRTCSWSSGSRAQIHSLALAFAHKL